MPASTGERKVLQAMAHGARANGFDVHVHNVPHACDVCGDADDVNKTWTDVSYPDPLGLNVTTYPDPPATWTVGPMMELGWRSRVRKAAADGMMAIVRALLDGFHRVVVDQMASELVCSNPILTTNATLLRKILLVEFFGLRPTGECGLAAHQLLTGWPNAHNTFIGLHGGSTRSDRPLARPAAGLILAKNPRAIDPLYNVTYFEGPTPSLSGNFTPLCVRVGPRQCSDNGLLYGSAGGSHPESPPIQRQLAAINPTLNALLEANVTMYTTFDQTLIDALSLPSGVRSLGKLSASEYFDTLGGISFALGIGYPLHAPSALDALANGAAFLNPRFSEPLAPSMISNLAGNEHTFTYTQHDPLTSVVGEPYVYTVDFQDPSTVVRAALTSARPEGRFSSFVPPILTEERINERVCVALWVAPEVLAELSDHA